MIMTQALSRFTTGATLALLLGAAAGLAQAADPTPNVDQRQSNQQQRIQAGEQSGKLTNGEANALNARENTLQNREAADKADGKVTPAEHRQLRRETRRDSHAVARDKNNAITPPK
jgi:cytochrome c556